MAAKGAVAAGHELTADAAAHMLAAGGSAADAAIAAALMACVAEPVLASPGGGGFAMVAAGEADPELFDFFAQTPIGTNPEAAGFDEAVADFGPALQAFAIGPASAATPGFVPGILALHRAHGRIPLSELAAPAVSAARTGVAVTAFQARLAEIVSPILLATEGARALFAPQGQLHAPGTMVHNPGLAGFLADLGSHGPAPYLEEVVPAILEGQTGGHLRRADFERYTVETRRPLRLDFGHARIFTNPAPAAGGILVGHTLAGLAGDTPLDHAQALHRTDRARRAAGGDLAVLVKGLGPSASRGTTHISVADAQGGAVAMTLTNGEGNGQAVGKFGFLLNNILGEEDVNGAGATGWAENVRLASMMAPSLARFADGGLMALGSGGSNRIRSAVAQVLAHAAIAGKTLNEAVSAPRLHVEAGHLEIEAGFSAADAAALCAAFPQNRVWPEPNMFFGGCHAIARHAGGRFEAAGDPRRAGVGRLA